MLVVGLCLLHFGIEKLRVILFPIFFSLAMFPLPAFINNRLSLKLKLISSRIGVEAMQWMGMTAYREGNIIDLGFTQLQVVDACNGLRYLFPLIVLAILVTHFSNSALWKKVIVVLSSIPISIFVNGLRIASVGLLVPVFGPKVAEGFFHDFSGWIIFMISFGILLAEFWILNRIFKENKKTEDKGGKNKVACEKSARPQDHSAGERIARQGAFPLQFLLAVLLLGTTATIAQTVNFREEVPITRSFNQFPLRVGEWVGQLQTMDQKFIHELDLSDYIIVTYRKGSSPPVNFYSTYYESQRKGESIHSPSSCLPGSGWEFQQAGRTEINLSKDSNIRFPVRRAVMSNAGHKQLSYYWFPMRGRVLTNIWEMKLYNFIDALTQQRTDGALARLITPIGNNETIEDADARLQGFTRELVPVLNEFLPQ
jgi:exosortase D (VPLPA-CTERM-specific)